MYRVAERRGGVGKGGGGERSQFSLATLLGGSKEKKLKGCCS